MTDFTTLTEEQLDALLEKKPERPKILGAAVRTYDCEASKYPETVRVSFMDGHTFVYQIVMNQPAPIILENIKKIRKMKQGYVNQPKRRRKKI